MRLVLKVYKRQTFNSLAFAKGKALTDLNFYEKNSERKLFNEKKVMSL